MGIPHSLTVDASLNEVDALCRKAARGVGYPFGLAEEAGRTARWLCRHDIDGCHATAALLSHVDRTMPLPWTIPSTRKELAGDSLSLLAQFSCPVTAGASLADHAALVDGKFELHFRVVQPGLLLPAVAHLALVHRMAVSLVFGHTTYVTDGNNVSIANANLTVQPPDSHQAVVIKPHATLGQPTTNRTRAAPTRAVWNTLESYAARTYAPATEESRLKGAGDGQFDDR